jgi:dihydropteroate synthase
MNNRALSNLLDLMDSRRTLIMGILNVTPDSFSDGGRFVTAEDAIAAAKQMVHLGADIIDVGGESTRPATFAGGTGVDFEEEADRIAPVVEGLCRALPDLPISIDTYRAQTAELALECGACFINDVSAFRADPRMQEVAAKSGAMVCLMHMNGIPGCIAHSMAEPDVTAAVRLHLTERAEAAERAGVAKGHILLDPGLGFGKSTEQNLELLRRQRELLEPGYPLLIGASRKRFLGAALGGAAVEDRLEGTLASAAVSIMNGASILRVHDVLAVKRTAMVTDAIVHGWR